MTKEECIARLLELENKSRANMRDSLSQNDWAMANVDDAAASAYAYAAKLVTEIKKPLDTSI